MKTITCKFGGYKVKVKKSPLTKIEEGEYKSVIEIIGDIEIGIEIDNMSWREDWLREIVFGKNTSAKSHRISSIDNHLNNNGDVPSNVVTSFWNVNEK
jgi:hypothetical protein